jgi:hypothetical protein
MQVSPRTTPWLSHAGELPPRALKPLRGLRFLPILAAFAFCTMQIDCVDAQPGSSPGSPALSPVSSSQPSVQIRLSKSMYRIRIDPKSGAPKMPTDIVATAEALNWPAGTPPPSTFLWRVYLDWDYKPWSTHHSIRDTIMTQPSPMRVDLKNEIRGGRLQIFAKTFLEGKEVWGRAQAEVRADNPSRAEILRAFPPNRFGLIASKIGMAESGLRQFTMPDPRSGDPGGLPVVSYSNDVGLMQLNAPSGSITSDDQIWDWRANLRRGLEMLEGKRRNTVLASRAAAGPRIVPQEALSAHQTVACLNFARLYLGLPCLPAPSIPTLSDQPGSGMLPDDPDPDHLALTQVERDAIRRYNGGREYAFVVLPDLEGLGIQAAEWQVDPTRGGIQNRRGDPNYVRHVLAARSGFKLPPPPQPKKTGRKTSHRRRRHR